MAGDPGKPMTTIRRVHHQPGPRLDRVTTRSEIFLCIGSFQLLLRRSTTITTITLPGYPSSEIHHWGVLANQPYDPQPKGFQMSKEGVSLLAEMRAERNQGRSDWRSMSPKYQKRFKAHLAKLRQERLAREAREKGPAVGALVRDSNPLGPPPKA